MLLRKLENVQQLLMFVSELTVVHTYDIRPFIWATNSSADTLIENLIFSTKEGRVINYGGFDDDGRIKYFLSVINKQPTAIIWLMHIKISQRDISKPVLKAVFEDLKSVGFTGIQFCSTNMAPSCKRWAKTLGATPIAINYQLKL